jgi:hypothetical protein
MARAETHMKELEETGAGSRAASKDEWDTRVTEGEAQRRVLSLAAVWGFAAVLEPEGVALQQGSQLMTRVFGGWFVNPKRLPKRGYVQITPAGNGSHIDVAIYEMLEFALVDPHLKRRYDAFCRNWTSALRTVLPQSSTTSNGRQSGDSSHDVMQDSGESAAG